MRLRANSSCCDAVKLIEIGRPASRPWIPSGVFRGADEKQPPQPDTGRAASDETEPILPRNHHADMHRGIMQRQS
jgi:hypothetical protein